MTLRDRVLITVLALSLVALSVAAIGPAVEPARDRGQATPNVPPSRSYVEGVLGRATTASPFGARSAADRALVALLFRGLVRLGPGESLAPDLASDWEPRDGGRTWIFHLRPEQRWHDGEPITAEDVAFTVSVLGDPEYTGPGGESWRDVSVEVIDPLTVALHLSVPLGGFPQVATQPVAPVHLLGGIPPAELPQHEFGQQPVASGAFRLVFLDSTRALLTAAGVTEPNTPGGGRPVFATPRPTDSFLTPRPTVRPEVPIPYISTLEFRWYDDLDSLAHDWETGALDAVTGLAPTDAEAFAAAADSRLARWPGTTLYAVVLNLRPPRTEFVDPAARRALLAAIDRDGLVAGPLAGLGTRADALIPPSASVFSRSASPPVPFHAGAAREALTAAGWAESSGSWIPKGSRQPLTIELLSPESSANPLAHAFAAGVVTSWQAIGLSVRHAPLPAAELLGERLATATFQAAVIPLAIGLDPDLYALLAASQTRTGGSNVAGLQDPELDKLLVAARTPLDPAERAEAYQALQVRLASHAYLLPLAFRDEYAVLRDTIVGPTARPVGGSGDRFWDVLTWRLRDGR